MVRFRGALDGLSGAPIVGLLLLPILTTFGGSAVMRWALNERHSAQTWVSHSHEAIGEARELGRSAMDAESHLLRYALEPQQEELDAIAGAAAGFDNSADKLRQLIMDNPAQQARLDAVEDEFAIWVRDVKQRLDSARGERQAVLEIARDEERTQTRSRLEAFIHEEERLLADRKESNEHATWVADLAMLGAIVAILASVLVVLRVVMGYAHDLRVLRQAAQRLGDGDLGTRAPASQRREVAPLASAFNWMADRLARRENEATLVNRLSESLHACVDREELMRVIERHGPALFEGADGSLYLYAASRDHLTRVVVWGTTIEPAYFEPDDCWAVRHARPHVYSSADRVTLSCSHVQGEDRSTLCVPLAAHGDMLGVFHLRFAAAETSARATELQRVAQLFGESAALSLANMRLRDSLRDQAIRDPLTGLYNRRYMEETLGRELSRAARKDMPLAVIIFDVDHFKRYNDQFGHGGGDALLRGLAEVAKNQFRTSDDVCRFGGEEFVIVMPDSDEIGATRRAEVLRLAVAQLQVRDEGKLLGKVTISAGVAAWPSHGNSAEDLLRQADGALYASKRNGRDRITVAVGRGEQVNGAGGSIGEGETVATLGGKPPSSVAAVMPADEGR